MVRNRIRVLLPIKDRSMMLANKACKIAEKVYLVGSKNLSHPLDCNIYFIDGSPRECVLVDSGSGLGVSRILKNIKTLGFDLGLVSAVVNTHCHYRHAGGNAELNELLGYCEVIVHELDARPIETGDPVATKSSSYGKIFNPCRVDVRIFEEEDGPMKWLVGVGDYDLVPKHCGGHTPGSTAFYGDVHGQKILFLGDLDSLSKYAGNSEISRWKKALHYFLNLDVEIICAGHKIIKRKAKEWLEKLLLRYSTSL